MQSTRQSRGQAGPGASNLSLMAVVLGLAVTPSTSLHCPEVFSDCHLFNQVHTPDWVCQDSIWQYFMFFRDLLIFTYILLQPIQQSLSALGTYPQMCLVYVWCHLLGLSLPASLCSSSV